MHDMVFLKKKLTPSNGEIIRSNNIFFHQLHQFISYDFSSVMSVFKLSFYFR